MSGRKDVWRRKKNPGGTSTYKITPGQNDIGKETLPRGLMEVSPTSTSSQEKANVSRANAGEVQIRDKYGVFADIAFGVTEGETPSWQRNRNNKKIALMLEKYDDLQGSDSVADVIARKNLEVRLKAQHSGAYQRYLTMRKERDESW